MSSGIQRSTPDRTCSLLRFKKTFAPRKWGRRRISGLCPHFKVTELLALTKRCWLCLVVCLQRLKVRCRNSISSDAAPVAPSDWCRRSCFRGVTTGCSLVERSQPPERGVHPSSDGRSIRVRAKRGLVLANPGNARYPAVRPEALTGRYGILSVLASYPETQSPPSACLGFL